MKRITFYLAGLCLLFKTSATEAQNSYTFSKHTGNVYSDLSGDITVNTFTSGLFMIPGLTGETFKFYGLDFTFGGSKTFAIGSAPFLRVDNDSSMIIMDGAFTFADSIDPSSKVSYVLQGTSGNRVIRVQYKNLKLRTGPAGNFVNLQICCYQQTGVIEVVYGPRSSNNTSGYNTVDGPNVGIFYSPDNFSHCYEKLWCEGSPAAMVLDSAANFDFDAMSGVPPEGTIYRFRPRFISPPLPPPVTTGIFSDTGKPALTVFPSPAEGELMVTGLQPSSAVVLSNMQSQVFYKAVTEEDHLKIDCSDLAEGIYLMSVQGQEGVLIKRVVISR